MVWQVIDEVEVEVAQEIRVVLQNQQDDPDSAGIEGFQSLCQRPGGQHVLLEEPERTHNQVLDLVPGLVLLLIGSPDKVRHEQSVRDELKPSESKGRVLLGRELLENLGHIEQNLPLGLRIKAVVADIHCSEDIDQEPVVRLLVELVLSLLMILLETHLNVQQDLVHELHFVELECLLEADDQLHKRVDKCVVEEPVVVAQVIMRNLLREAKRCLDRHIAELVQVLGVSLNKQEGLQVCKERIHFRLLFLRIRDVGKFDPLKEELLRLLLERVWLFRLHLSEQRLHCLSRKL